MGSGQSATQSQHPEDEELDDEFEERHITISNKMVERLVEDATLAGEAAAATPAAPRGDYKDNLLIEKLKCIDEKHSERFGITIEDLNATAARIEMRSAHMASAEPVCEQCKQQVIDCYVASESPKDVVKCWESIDAFTTCVQEAGAQRLRARTEHEERERARRTRHVARARGGPALRDLAAPRASTTAQ